METDTENKIIVKIIFAVLLSSELKMHLKNSVEWKNDLIDKNKEPLNEIIYKDQSYFGFHADQNQLTISDLENSKRHFLEKLSIYCPDFNAERLDFFIFPQVFIK